MVVCGHSCLLLPGDLWQGTNVAKKSNPSMFRPGLKLSVLITGTAFGLMACSDSGGETVDGDVGPSTMGSSTMGPTTMGGTTMGPTTVGGPTTGGTSTSATTGGSTTTGGPTTGGPTTGGPTTGGPTTGTTMGSTTMGSTTMGSTTTGAGGSTGAGGASTGAGGTGATTAEDFDPMASDFTCIAEWQAILGFRINNFLGHLDEAVAVAENPEGGVYPVGTILQHFPTEAMVKRRAGFSPDTKDWEFFLLNVSQDGTTTITSRGTTEITTMGDTCASCHAMADDKFDFVCNTYGDAGSANCGFDLMPAQLDSQIANDPRCD